jgi:hypothetical protein
LIEITATTDHKMFLAGIAGIAVFAKAQQIWRIKSIAIREH